jgi:hypothetical protein
MNSPCHKFSDWQQAMDCARVLVKPTPSIPAARFFKPRQRELVAGGDIKWRPINKTAALVTARAPWWATPPQSQPVIEEKPKTQQQKKHTMQRETTDQVFQPAANYKTAGGIKIIRVNGEEMIDIDSARQWLYDEISEMPNKANPHVKAAEDARKIIEELCQGIGGEMERFDSDTRRHIETIRGKRMTMIAETSQMVGALKEIRQFFLGADYKDEIQRLSEFIDLCERLHKLKESGFLDTIADTMLSLSVGRGQ